MTVQLPVPLLTQVRSLTVFLVKNAEGSKLPGSLQALELQRWPAGGGVSADISMLLHVSQVADVSLQLLGGGVGTDVQTLMGVQGEAADLLQTWASSRRSCR